MSSRRQIREAVVQFLYGFDLEGGADPTPLRDPFWQFITESDRRQLLIATWKTLHHLNLSRKERTAEFQTRLNHALDSLHGDPDAEPLRQLLNRLSQLESDWARQFDPLDTHAHKPTKLPTDELADSLDALFDTDRKLTSTRIEFLKLSDDFPHYRAQLEPVSGSIHRLDRISERIRTIENPERFPERPELARIRQSRADLRELRTRTDQLVDQIFSQKEMLDATLQQIIDNFAPERIDPIDRAILRLATWEILHDPEVPKPVAINEAIEIARKFGTTDSPRFVNGVLDQINPDAIIEKKQPTKTTD